MAERRREYCCCCSWLYFLVKFSETPNLEATVLVAGWAEEDMNDLWAQVLAHDGEMEEKVEVQRQREQEQRWDDQVSLLLE